MCGCAAIRPRSAKSAGPPSTAGSTAASGGIFIDLQGPIAAIGRDLESGRALNFRIDATIGGRAAGSVRVPTDEASEVAVTQLRVWCAEIT
ncbi:hypothetical protein NCAST_19_01140 [Nocardia asteroides NBRC 15531]|uniref:Uncharacterized protein n=1 Tax=Nocardia asteroides NBRC 15531 TaxID=1110697 RepID=U5E3Z9_NOCAS|nr:hypothetical protein NCAST_19_01140 [Nocardia asteroides NBRC 15531]